VAVKRTERSRAHGDGAGNGAGMSLAVAVPAEGGGALPEYASPEAAGADLRASEALEIPPGGRAAVSTGLRLAIPSGFVGLVWPRSGLAVRHGIDTLAGVIDSDYRGEVRVVLQNHGREPFRIAPGDRIAQLLVQPVVRAAFAHGQGLADTKRGEGGFGSTGR
jgi:dUTP pyrophosphatase